MSPKQSTTPRSGFTIVELMIATSVFSAVLLVVTAGILAFTRHYTKGIVATQVQTVARDAMDELTQGVQFGSNGLAPQFQLSTNAASGKTWGLCIGNKSYYILTMDKIISSGVASEADHTTRHAFISSTQPCSTIVPDIRNMTDQQLQANGGRELLSDNMRFAGLDIEPVNSSGRLFSIDLRVAYGDDDLLCTPPAPDPFTVAAFWAPITGPRTCTATVNYDAGYSPNVSCRAGNGNEYCYVVKLSNVTSVRL